MLLQIREKVSGWIAYGIIFLISIPFALFGVNSYLGGGEVPPAAIVNGDEISLQDLDRAYANYRQRLSQLFGGRVPDSFGTENEMRDHVLGQLIEEFATRQYVDEKRYRVGDAALGEAIREMEVFHTDGQFDPARYQAQLRSIGASALGFEQELRSNQALNQFRAGIQDTAFVTPLQEKQFASLANQSRKIRTLGYSADVTNIEIGEEEIVERYEALPDRFKTPEQLKIDYIEVNLDSIRESIVVDESSSRARYEESLDNYTTPEIRNASHILIKIDDTVDSDTALARINELESRLEQGESFADLAIEFSEDPISAAEGGNLGDIERGFMVQAFENSLFGLQVGETSEPVKTTFGWHLIKLHEVSGGESQTFESVREEIESEIATELAESQIFDLVDSLANLAYEQPDSLLPASEQLELELQTSDWFDRGSGSGIATNPRVRQAAFSGDVYQQGLNSEAIELDDNRVLFLRINEIKASELRPMDEVRGQIRQELILSALREQNQKDGEQALESLRAGESLDELAEQWGTSVTDHGFITRSSEDVELQVKNAAFTMQKPGDGVVYQGVLSAGGDYNIIELSAVVSSDGSEDEETVGTLRSTMAAADYQAISRLLMSRSDVVRTPLEDLEYPGEI